jgi:hypothetical protein
MRSPISFLSVLLVSLMMLVYKSARADEVYHDETRAYIGLQWIFGDTLGALPYFMLGIRQSRTRVNNIVTGGDMSFAVSLDTLRPDSIRISYLEGKCNFLGQYGFGYSFKKQANLFFFGVAGPFSKLFAEIDSGKNPAVGLEMNTQDCAGRIIR